MSSSLLSLLVDGSMVILPVTGYIDQFRKIQNNKNQQGFSLWICFILLVANILRIFFWIGKRFEMNMLLQSIIMIIAQLAIIFICCKYPNREQKGNSLLKGNLMDWNTFWKWEDMISYVLFLVSFTITLSITTLLFLNDLFYFEMIGFFALTIESVLGVPQAYQNYKNHSTQGLSLVLIGTWFLGDAYKTIYFIMKALPFQFILCGIVQLIVDCIIVAQIALYKQ